MFEFLLNSFGISLKLNILGRRDGSIRAIRRPQSQFSFFRFFVFWTAPHIMEPMGPKVVPMGPQMEPMVPEVMPMGPKMTPMGPQMMPLGSKVSADGTQSGANGTQSCANDAQSDANGTQRPHSWKSLESDPPGEGRCRFFDRRLQRNGRSGIHIRIQRILRIPRIRCHRLLLGTTLPRAPGVRMT